jgi:sugar diacid utilization regulator
MLQQNKEHHGDNAMVSRYLRKDEYLVNYKNNNMLIIASAHSGIVERIQRVFEFKSNSFKIFIGPESSDVNQSFQCVLSIVQVCQYFKVGGDIVHFKDIVLEKALFGIRDDYFIKTLKNIFEKKDHSFDLRNTIKAYFLYSGNNLKVCENLNIHRNTLLYRLKKIKEFTDKDPKCYKDLFILYCAALVNS